MGKAISALITGLTDLLLWFFVVVMLAEGTVPKTGFAAVLLLIAVTFALISMVFDAWLWFANRRRA